MELKLLAVISTTFFVMKEIILFLQQEFKPSLGFRLPSIKPESSPSFSKEGVHSPYMLYFLSYTTLQGSLPHLIKAPCYYFFHHLLSWETEDPCLAAGRFFNQKLPRLESKPSATQDQLKFHGTKRKGFEDLILGLSKRISKYLLLIEAFIFIFPLIVSIG